MAENTFLLEVVTPERIALSDEVQFVVAPSVVGELGLLKNHAPIVAGLRIGVLRYTMPDGEVRHMAISGGLMENIDNEAKVLAETAEHGREIDLLRAKAAKDRAERRLAERQDQISYVRAQMALLRAIARIRASEMDQ
ncbi:MAG: F0F1 ATP synthase subunit epsilon [Syntrophomonadaceae bacterium]|nr:F0F1 ATP synthase subunit epsilon [Syntrophomonadaceae bacterium]